MNSNKFDLETTWAHKACTFQEGGEVRKAFSEAFMFQGG